MDILSPPLDSVHLPDYVDPAQRPLLGKVVDYVYVLLKQWVQQLLDTEPNLETAIRRLCEVQEDMGFIRDDLRQVQWFLVYTQDAQEYRRG